MTQWGDRYKALALLPDLPRWVEVRSMLLSGRASVIGIGETGSPSFVAFDADTGSAAVVGRPGPELVRTAAANTSELLALPENAEHVAGALTRDWIREAATLHVLKRQSLLPAVDDGTVRYLDRAEVISHAHGLVPELRGELLDENRRGTRIAAAFVGEQAVAFCYAGSITERWWDISIDTVEPYRRRGYAARCVAFCVREMARLGKNPVWGAFVSNTPSLRLAAKLGFEPVDSLVVFSRERPTPGFITAGWSTPEPAAPAG